MMRVWPLLLFLLACGRSEQYFDGGPIPAGGPQCNAPAKCHLPDGVLTSQSDCPAGLLCLHDTSAGWPAPDSGVLDGVCIAVQTQASPLGDRLWADCDACGQCTFTCAGLVGFACPVGMHCTGADGCCDRTGTCQPD